MSAANETTIIPMMFSAMPARTIFGIVRSPDPKTIALGGVATGNMKAQLAANVTGTVSTIGSMPDLYAMAAMTGRKVAVVAILLVNSVRKTISVVTAITIIASGSMPTA